MKFSAKSILKALSNIDKHKKTANNSEVHEDYDIEGVSMDDDMSSPESEHPYGENDTADIDGVSIDDIEWHFVAEPYKMESDDDIEGVDINQMSIDNPFLKDEEEGIDFEDIKADKLK